MVLGANQVCTHILMCLSQYAVQCSRIMCHYSRGATINGDLRYLIACNTAKAVFTSKCPINYTAWREQELVKVLEIF